MIDSFSNYNEGFHGHDQHDLISPDHPTDHPLVHVDVPIDHPPADFSTPDIGAYILNDYVASLQSTNIDDLVWVNNPSDNIYGIMSKTFDLDIHGNPLGELSNFHYQDSQNSCAIAATSSIFKSLGHDLGEDFLSEAFQNLHVYDPLSGQNLHVYDPSSGTKILFIDDAINEIANVNHWGIRADEIHGFTADQLKGMLDSGSRILVGVNGSELYENDSQTLKEIYETPENSGHAVQLTGIIESANGSSVVINDPGLSNGDGVEIPMDRFMNAAADFNHTAIRVS
jgi:Peptidase_C39 like family